MSRGESKRITDIDDSMASSWLDKFPLLMVFGAGSLDLQTPLLGKQECQSADVGVFLVADLFRGLEIAGDIAEHGESGIGLVAVAMEILESAASFQAQSCGEGGKHGFGDDVGFPNEVVEDFDVVWVLDNGREIDVFAFGELVSGNLVVG
jgi:hypothetical protein